jgi:hypothetical protein
MEYGLFAIRRTSTYEWRIEQHMMMVARQDEGFVSKVWVKEQEARKMAQIRSHDGSIFEVRDKYFDPVARYQYGKEVWTCG